MAGDWEESSLANWLSVQQVAAQNGTLVNTGRSMLDGYDANWDPGSRETAWYRNADALGAFLRKHGRWPSKSGANEERRLGSWLHNRRQDARTREGLSRDRLAYLDRVAPNWNV